MISSVAGALQATLSSLLDQCQRPSLLDGGGPPFASPSSVSYSIFTTSAAAASGILVSSAAVVSRLFTRDRQ